MIIRAFNYFIMLQKIFRTNRKKICFNVYSSIFHRITRQKLFIRFFDPSIFEDMVKQKEKFLIN